MARTKWHSHFETDNLLNMTTKIFLSYARADDGEPFDPGTSFVARLYRDLTACDFDVWWDRERMPSRALPFPQEIQNAVEQCERLVFVAGPKATQASEWCSYEWRHALKFARAINPILRSCDFESLPSEMRFLDLDTRDFRDDSAYAGQLEALVRQLREPVAPMGKLIGVPSLPPHFLAQPDRLRALKEAVLADLHRAVVITPETARTGLHGMGGIGKSVLATTLALDAEVRRAFPDGIVWVPVGEHPNITGLQRDIAAALGDPGHFENEYQGKARLTEIFKDRTALIVLDDVWNSADVQPFEVLDTRGRMIITTRDASQLTAIGGTQLPVPLLGEVEARRFLAKAAGCAENDLSPEAQEIILHCGRLPLALSICGAMVRDGTRWRHILEALQEADLEYLDHPLGNILTSITASLKYLDESERSRFLELCVFPPDETSPEAAVFTLWRHTGSLRERHAAALLAKLERRSLIQYSPDRGVGLHDILYAYACHAAGGTPASDTPGIVRRPQAPPALHQKLLDAYSKQCPNGWPSGPNDGYFFQRLRDHLIQAGQSDELVSLLLDLPWLEAKAGNSLVFDLPADFGEALQVARSDHAQRRFLPLIEEALRRDIHFIARHREDFPQALFQCLWNLVGGTTAQRRRVTTRRATDLGQGPGRNCLSCWMSGVRPERKTTVAFVGFVPFGRLLHIWALRSGRSCAGTREGWIA
jgi:NB-ARC domain/TIR domain/APAF-1 helical domain